MWYRKGEAFGVRRKFGDRKQIFQVSVKNTRQLQDTIARAYQVDGVFEVQRLDFPLPAENGRGLK